MPRLTLQQEAQLKAYILETSLDRIAFHAPRVGYRITATAVYVSQGIPRFPIAITWYEEQTGAHQLVEMVHDAIVTPGPGLDPEYRVALNQLQRVVSKATRIFQYHVSLAEIDQETQRKKNLSGARHLIIEVPSTDEARASTVAAMNELAAVVRGGERAIA